MSDKKRRDITLGEMQDECKKRELCTAPDICKYFDVCGYQLGLSPMSLDLAELLGKDAT